MMAMLDLVSFGELSVFALFVLLVCLTFVSEDLTCIGAGLLVAQGTIGFVSATLACVVGILIGNLFLYVAGRTLGRRVLRYAPFKWFVKVDDINRCTIWFRANGPMIIIASRFLPGSRLPTFVAAGILRLPFRRFMVYFVLTLLAWAPLLVGLAVWFGNAAKSYLAIYERYAAVGFVAVALVLFVAVTIIVPLFSFKGRRMLLSVWRRKTRWEFWPPWVFYTPMAIYVLYLGLKYRCVTMFTSVNPAIPASGFIGESKHDILAGLSPSQSFVARGLFVPVSSDVEQRTQSIVSFMKEHALVFPIVLKPDAGQRGQGVAIVSSLRELESYVAAASWNLLAQEYIGGAEFGVFYYRLPDEEHGRILSITEKRFTSVTGDGHATLEHLILADDRAVCAARLYLNMHHGRLYDVPARDEVVPLARLGTHCRGAMFLDGAWANTPALEQAIDTISKAYDGFYFGRYDIRVPDIEDFQSGKNFKIIELNGVTSEATHIYDPKHSLLYAYRVLREQWRIAFEIGAFNAKRGTPPISVRELWGMLRRYEVPSI